MSETIRETMRAAVISDQKTLSICDLPKPTPGKGQLLLKVSACGICGSDLHAVDSGFAPAGVVLGHEYAGEVVAFGEGIDEQRWQIGDRVNGLGALYCGECEQCLALQYEQCPEFKLVGLQLDAKGAYSEYMTVNANVVFKIPDEVSNIDAAAVEPLAVGYSAYCVGKVKPGESVLIIGAGPIGTAIALWARYFGVRHVGISDLNKQRLQRAVDVGADVQINAAEEKDPVAAFIAQTGTAPSVIFECTGVSGMLSRLISASPAGAHLVLAGTAMQKESITVSAAAMKKLCMTFALGYTAEDFSMVMDLLAEKRISTRHIVTGTVSLDEVPDIFETLKKPNAHGKVIITP